MANYNGVARINDYMKMGGAGDFCVVCAKKMCNKDKIDAYEAQRKLKGLVQDKKVVIVRTSGIDQCICMNCIKDIYDEHVAPTLTTETSTEE